MKLITEIEVIELNRHNVTLRFNQRIEGNRSMLIDNEIKTMYPGDIHTMNASLELAARQVERRKGERRHNILKLGRRETDRRG